MNGPLSRWRSGGSSGRDWAADFPPPEIPWTHEYNDVHRGLVEAAVTDAELRRACATGRRLPARYGVGLDERVVEYPWVFGHGIGGRVLDAGSTFNHAHILDLALPQLDSLTITTLEPEAHAFPERRVSYVFGDLRALPFRDDWFDTTVCVSTLEHVGMDNTIYGAADEHGADADAEVARCATELRRVTRPGGTILLTVPFGRAADHGWFRVMDEAAVTRMVAAFGPADSTTTIFRYDAEGWQRCRPRDAKDAVYRDFMADPRPVADRAAAARAVACVRLTA